MRRLTPTSRGFTLMEMIVVITIIAILMSLLFPALRSAMDSQKRTSAKHTEQTIVNGVKQYYVEYGKYPINRADTSLSGTSDVKFPESAKTEDLMSVLTASGSSGTWDFPKGINLNPRRLQFMDARLAKSETNPTDGLAKGKMWDPWGNEYHIVIDYNYDNKVEVPYADFTSGVIQGCVVFTYGKDGQIGDKVKADKKAMKSDDVVSWL